MTPYRITFKFNNFHANHRSSLPLDIKANEYIDAYLLAEHLKKIYGADDYEINERTL